MSKNEDQNNTDNRPKQNSDAKYVVASFFILMSAFAIKLFFPNTEMTVKQTYPFPPKEDKKEIFQDNRVDVMEEVKDSLIEDIHADTVGLIKLTL